MVSLKVIVCLKSTNVENLYLLSRIALRDTASCQVYTCELCFKTYYIFCCGSLKAKRYNVFEFMHFSILSLEYGHLGVAGC